MSIRKIIDWAIQASSTTLQGTIASEFYESYDSDGNWVWACDVDIGEEEVLEAVPVASNNREIIYAEVGKGVTMSRLSSGSWVITGLSKSQNSTRHYIYVVLEDDTYAISRKQKVGYSIRPLTYGELSSIPEPDGYGQLPYGSYGKFDAEGNFVEIVIAGGM